MEKFTKDVTEQLQQKLGKNYEIRPIELTKLNFYNFSNAAIISSFEVNFSTILPDLIFSKVV